MRLVVPLLVLALTGACRMTAAQAVEDVFRDVRASVVTVRTRGEKVLPQAPGRPTAIQGLGSGVLFTPEGDILTAAHVVQTADAVVVEFPDGETRAASVVASSPSADVALVRLNGGVPAGVRPAPLGDSDLVEVGQAVMVVGAPLGITHTLTVGHVSARRLDRGPFSPLAETEYFQTDAAINQGNSGGPLFNMKGEVIGIVSHIVSKDGGSQGLGFAVTSNVARRLLVEGRSVWTGVHGLLLSAELAAIFNVPEGGQGYLVQEVAQGSLGDDLGLKGGQIPVVIGGYELLLGGDIILEVAGVPVSEDDAQKVRDALNAVELGDQVRVTVLRGGRLVELEASLEV